MLWSKGNGILLHSGLDSVWHFLLYIYIFFFLIPGTRPSTMLSMPRSRQSSVTSSQENLLDRVDHSRSKNSTLTRKNSGIPMFTSPPKTADGKKIWFVYLFFSWFCLIIFSFFLLLQKLIVFDFKAVWFIKKYPGYFKIINHTDVYQEHQNKFAFFPNPNSSLKL